MKHYAGIDVSLNSSSVCVVDASGKIVREVKVVSEPVALINWFKSLCASIERIGLEAGPLSQWLYGALRESGLPVELLETRQQELGDWMTQKGIDLSRPVTEARARRLDDAKRD